MKIRIYSVLRQKSTYKENLTGVGSFEAGLKIKM